MTIVFTGILSHELIVTTVDSAVKLEFETHNEYDTGRKAYCYPGVGCVATWGTRDANRIGEFLNAHKIDRDTYSIDELAKLVDIYLREEYRPHEAGLGDVGYHVTGFDRNGNSYLSHVFWGFDKPRPPEQTHRKYAKYDHVVSAGQLPLFYNGRNDLAEVVVSTLLERVVNNSDSNFNIGTSIGLARFGDFIARFAAELTPEVGPPFLTFLISPHNEIQYVVNESLCPITEDKLVPAFEQLNIDQ